ncbi:unnamed protein product [Durusdinium trenchii]|uniref:Cilia- and flagella-associated protein 157 n=1 Tax=Durusdinium trenchii TaxID=1381693 RepID=A0ABP0HBA7_9DINO
MSSKTLQDLQDDELRPDGSPSRRFSRSYTQPEPSESMMGKRGGMVEVGWTFFREAAAAKDRIVDLERELQKNLERYEDLCQRSERLQLRAEAEIEQRKRCAGDCRDLNMKLHTRVSTGEHSKSLMQSRIEALQDELRQFKALEVELRKELLRALHEEEHVGTHVDLLASEGELRRTRDCLELKEKELKASQEQLLELQQIVVSLRSHIEEQGGLEQVHLQCKDCEQLESFYQSKLSFSNASQEQLEAALANSLTQQEALRWELVQERRQHESLKKEHNDRMLEARQESAFLRKALAQEKQERRWRHPKPPKPPVLSEEPPVELPATAPLWWPAPETKLQLKDLLPEVRYVKARAHHLYPKAGPPKTAG